MAMKVEILSKKFIKPSTPTPPSLRHYKIAFIDEFAPSFNVPFILFYPAKQPNTTNPKFVINQLEKSLEQTLTRYYPLAGRYIRDIRTVDCNDAGAEFIHSRVNIHLQKILDPQVKSELLSNFLPCGLGALDEPTDPLLAAQVTMFECGGLAIGLCISHRISDASTLNTFLNDWAGLSRGARDKSPSSGFNAASYFPGRGLTRDDLALPRTGEKKYPAKRFWFSEEAISKMRDVSTKLNERKSKVQLVSALIWKALVGVDRAKHGNPKPSTLVQLVNIRDKTTPPIPKETCGNLWEILSTECTETESLMDFAGFVDILGDSVKKTIKDYAKLHPKSKELQTKVMNSFLKMREISDRVNVFWLTSWCKFSFYEVDFGWGKPIWVTWGSAVFRNSVLLLDGAEGNGIDAYVFMDEKDIPHLEQDHDITAFAA